MNNLAVDFDDDPQPESFETSTPVKVVKLPLPAPEPPQAKPALVPLPSPLNGGGARILPHSLEAEESLLSCCLIEGSDVLRRCLDAKVDARHFYDPKHAIVFEHLQSLHARNLPIDAAVLAEELKKSRQLEMVGGFGFITQITARMPTSAQALYFIERVREQAALRELIRVATSTVENCYSGSVDLEQLATEFAARLKEISAAGAVDGAAELKPLADFTLLSDTDHSVLLGNRYLNRGDGAVLVSTSGMGKSSMSLQMAALWALGREAFGVKPNGPLRSLIIQSEDSDGDIAEIWYSIRHALKLTEDEVAQVRDRVKIVCDRVNRGDAFLRLLRRTIKSHKPDLVWINPLQAFIDGDVTDSQDIGRFLREGLNGLNEKQEFAYMLVHHTTKPSTGADRSTRLWHEVMYDMAGGAEIINWARAILSLRAAADEGNFNLVLAKRGRRAGVTRQVEQGAGWREEIVTTLPLKHAKGFIKVPGRAKDLPMIFWEPREPDPEPEDNAKGGRPNKNPFSDFANVFPAADSTGLALGPLHRLLIQNKEITKSTLHSALSRWVEEGLVQVIELENQPVRYRKAPRK